MDKLRMQPQNEKQYKIEKLKELFPNALTKVLKDGETEYAINFDLLKQKLSPAIVEGEEFYQFTWLGKDDAEQLADEEIKKTLRPCKEESVDFDNTQNLYIEGDNLDVLKLLKDTYRGKIKMIYIDPPYNTGSDLIYDDKFAQDKEGYEKATGERDEEGNRLRKNDGSDGYYHCDWCSMIYPRLILAQKLLSDEGVIFISIDDNEQANLKKICDEVFGPVNFICSFIRQTRKGGGSMSRFVSSDHDYVLMYSKNIASLKRLYVPYDKDDLKRFNKEKEDERGKFYWDTFTRDRQGSANYYTIEAPDGTQLTDEWIYKKEEFLELLRIGEIRFIREQKKGEEPEWSLQRKQRMNENGKIMRSPLLNHINSLGTKSIKELFGRSIFTYCKPPELIKHFATAVLKNDDIILDFFSGSATTAHAVMQLNAADGGHRRFIMVQLPEKCGKETIAFEAGYKNICEIGKERIRRAGKKILEENPLMSDSLDVGFRVLKLDSSNMEDVYYTPELTKQGQLKRHVDTVKNGKRKGDKRTSLDLLFQVILDPQNESLLSSKIEETTICGKTVFKADGNDLICCFDKGISTELLEKIVNLNPKHVVLRESSLIDNNARIHCDLLFNKSGNNICQII